jgi:uncharacterized membrane-anchored protein YitT (DUF2179 family)
MSERPESPLATPFIGVIGLLGCAALAFSITELPQRVDLAMLIVLMAIAGVAQRKPVVLFRSSSISVAFAATIASYVLYGPAVALWVNLVSALVNSFTPKPKPTRKIVFNLGSFTLAAFIAAHAYAALAPVPPRDIPMSLAAVLVSAVLYFTVGSGLTALVIALTSGSRFVAVWRQNYSWMPLNYVATAVNGAALALAYQALGLFGTAVFLLPLGVAWYSFRLYVVRSADTVGRIAELSETNRTLQIANERLEQAHVSALTAVLGQLRNASQPNLDALASADPTIAVARGLGLSDDEVAAVHLGSALHDIGKMAIPDAILAKTEPLTGDEWAQVRAHPVLGDQLLSRVPSLQKIRPIVLSHHERYDGAGYPHGLVGDQIPLGARIIAVADAWEAMTSTRPYRPALSAAEAIQELRATAGTQLDPTIVERFVHQVERSAQLGAFPLSVTQVPSVSTAD